jgi:hypothetical protein
MPVIPAFRRLMPENKEIQASLGYNSKTLFQKIMKESDCCLMKMQALLTGFRKSLTGSVY